MAAVATAEMDQTLKKVSIMHSNTKCSISLTHLPISLQAFTDLQMAKIEMSKKLRLLDMQAETLRVSKQRVDITEKEITSMPADTK